MGSLPLLLEHIRDIVDDMKDVKVNLIEEDIEGLNKNTEWMLTGIHTYLGEIQDLADRIGELIPEDIDEWKHEVHRVRRECNISDGTSDENIDASIPHHDE
jgi:hypothetical protein